MDFTLLAGKFTGALTEPAASRVTSDPDQMELVTDPETGHMKFVADRASPSGASGSSGASIIPDSDGTLWPLE